MRNVEQGLALGGAGVYAGTCVMGRGLCAGRGRVVPICSALRFELALRAHLPGCQRFAASRAASESWPTEAMARLHRWLPELNSARREPTGSQGRKGGGGRGFSRMVMIPRTRSQETLPDRLTALLGQRVPTARLRERTRSAVLPPRCGSGGWR